MEKPKMFKNPINKIVDNNKTLDKISSEQISENYERSIKTENKFLSIKSKVNNIFASKNYIYKADVVIKLKDNIIERRIIGLQNEQLITMENEMIPINEIVDIYVKEK